MADYIPVPVAAAKEIAEKFSKSVVIICAWDPKFGQLHTTTYGESADEKAWAADGGEIVANALGTMPDKAKYFENYRQHCCVKAGHVLLKPERECTSCLTSAMICENLSKPCCSSCMHQAVRCVAHPQPDKVNGASNA